MSFVVINAIEVPPKRLEDRFANRAGRRALSRSVNPGAGALMATAAAGAV